jgi:hypothetical protein
VLTGALWWLNSSINTFHTFGKFSTISEALFSWWEI